MTADFDGVIDAAQLAAVEAGANAVIRENLPVTVSYPDSETLSAMKYRSKLDLTENVRIVSVGLFSPAFSTGEAGYGCICSAVPMR